jgi:hypothetical protein
MMVMSKTKLSTNRVINRGYAYALPMIALPHNLRLDELSGFLGVYLFHEGHTDLQDKIYLHFNLYEVDKGYKNVYSILESSKYLEFFEYPDKFSIVYCFRIPEEYKREYEKLLQSKYSEFSENYKKSIIKFHNLENPNNPSKNKRSVINVLYKTEEGYRTKEEYINEGLPSRDWTRIPRGQEIGALLEEIKDAETFKTGGDDLDV